MATLGDIAIGLRMDSSKFSAGATGARREVGLLGKVFGSVTGQIATLAASAAGAFSLFKIASWGGSMAIQAEKSSIAFEVLLGSASKAERMLKQIEDYAAVTPYELAGTREAAQLLLNFGVAGERIMPTLSMLGDIGMGDAEKLHRMAVAFGQSSSAGRLMGQDLLQMINAGFNPLQEISARTGESMADLKKRMEEGGIGTAEVTQAFKDATSEGGRFFNMSARQSQTTAGLFSTLKDNVGLALRDVATALMGGFDIKGLFRGGIEATQAFRDNIAAWLPTFTQIGGWVRYVVDLFVKGYQFIVPWLPLLTEWVTIGLSVAGTWGGVVAIIGGFGTVIAGIVAAFNPITLLFAGIVIAVQQIWTHWSTVGPLIMQSLHMIGEVGSAAWSFVLAVATSVWNAITEVVGGFFGWMGGVTSGWRDGILTALIAVEFGFKHMGAIAQLIGTVMMLKFVEVGNTIAHFFTGTLPAVFETAYKNGGTFFLNLAGYAAAIFEDLVFNIEISLDNAWRAATGRRSSGRKMRQVGSGFQGKDYIEVKFPERETSDFEKGLGDAIKTQREALAKDFAAFQDQRLKALGLQPGGPDLGHSAKDYVSGNDAAEAEIKKQKAAAEKTEKAVAPKLAGAIGVGSKDFFASIFQSRGGAAEQAQRTRQQQLQEAREQKREQIRLRKLAEANKVGLIAGFGGFRARGGV